MCIISRGVGFSVELNLGMKEQKKCIAGKIRENRHLLTLHNLHIKNRAAVFHRIHILNIRKLRTSKCHNYSCLSL